MTENPDTVVTTSVDISRDGVNHGYLCLPSSTDQSAWGLVRLPITVIKNGDGPSVLFTGGNHGDEYEGPIALLNLAAQLEATSVKGRVVIIPCLNAPAVKAGKRTSPLDSGNMNRAFPGKADGTITEKIADYLTRYIIPHMDYVVDFHSGGKTLNFLSFAAIHELDDQAQQAKALALLDACGAPNLAVLRELDDRGMLDTTVEAMGKVFLTTELGGGGSSTPQTNATAKTICRNVLVHTGIKDGSIEQREKRLFTMPGTNCFISSDGRGMLEMMVELGQAVEGGEVIALVHDYEKTGSAPQQYAAKMAGTLIGRHHPGLIEPGDCLAVLAVEAST